MKFVAERFGALPRGKTMSSERRDKLKAAFEDTPIYDETLREAMLEKADLQKVKQIMHDVKEGKITVSTLIRSEKPTPLAYHILTQYADITELMAPERVILSNIDRMKHVNRSTNRQTAVHELWRMDKPGAHKRLSQMNQNAKTAIHGCLRCCILAKTSDKLKDDLQKRREGKELTPEELKELEQRQTQSRLDFELWEAGSACVAGEGCWSGNGFADSGQDASEEDEFYMDLLKAKIQYLRTREFWDR